MQPLQGHTGGAHQGSRREGEVGHGGPSDGHAGGEGEELG